jgi:hypothetical protein
MANSDWSRARAEGQRRRIIHLLEEIADEDPKDQCLMCGEWFDQLSAHTPHCDGPD